MKSYGEHNPDEGAGINFLRLAIPHGRQFPRAPVQGELFYLDAEIDGQDARPTFVRGLYICPGFGWQLFSEQFGQRKAAPVGSQNIEVEKPANIKLLPTAKDGFQIAVTGFQVQHRKVSVSGTGTFWAALSKDGHLMTSVFRNGKLVALTVDELKANTPRSIAITFIDLPGNSTDVQTYSLRVNTTADWLYINQTHDFDYDGAAQTAFIIAENN